MLKNKGNEAFTKNDFQTAIQYYMQTLKYNPHHDGAWNNMGLAYRSMDDYKSAIKCFRKAIELNPNNESALTNKESCEYELNSELLGLKKKKDEKKPLRVAMPTPVVTAPASPKPAAAVREEISPAAKVSEKEKVVPSAPKDEGGAKRESRMTAMLEKASEVLSSSPLPGEEKRKPEAAATVPFVQEEKGEPEAENAAPFMQEEKREPKAAATVPFMQEEKREPETEAPPPFTKEEKKEEPRPEVKETEALEEEIPPPPETIPENKAEPELSRKTPNEEKYIVEERMGPLGLRPTVVIRTTTERDYAEEYRKQRSARTGFPYYKNERSSDMGAGNDTVTIHPSDDDDEPLIEAKVEMIEPRSITHNMKDQRLCDYCRNAISSENRSIRCVWCGSFFCSTCERDFRGKREKGEKAVCAKCFLREIKEKERGKLEREKERKREDKLDEQRRLREKLDEERRLREDLEVERRKMRESLDEERRKKERLEDEQRFRDRLDEEKRRMMERLEEERDMRKAMEREFMLNDRMDPTKRKKDWISGALGERRDSARLNYGREDTDDEVSSLRIEQLEDEIASLGRSEMEETLPVEDGGEREGSVFTVGSGLIHIGPDEDVFDVLLFKFESGEITSEEYERLIEEALEG